MEYYPSQMCERVYQQAVASVSVDPVTSLTLVLAALAVLLTALAIMIGIAAIWGYTGLKEEARRIATEAAHKKLIEYFEKESLRDTIRTMVDPTTPIPVAPQNNPEQSGNGGDIYTGEET